MKEYRVVTPTDSLWRDKLNASSLQAGLNAMAREGWEMKGDGSVPVVVET